MKAVVGQSEAGGVAAQHTETILGVNLENPWLLWGFVAASLILAAAVLPLWQPVFLLAIALVGVATVLDVREIFFQIDRANAPVAILALVVALTHIAAGVAAAAAWRALRAAPVASTTNNRT